MFARAPRSDPAAAAEPLPITVASLSEAGGRASNEDALAFRTTSAGTCFVLSDGAGGHAGGAVASRLIVDEVIRSYVAAPGFDVATIGRCLADAEASLRKARRDNAAHADMSGTVAMLLLDASASHALWGHLGDTRVCHFRRGSLLTVTRDHSVVQRLIDGGLVSPAQALLRTGRNLLYAALGSDGGTPPAVASEPVALEDGDAFLLCTDGFWNVVDEAATQKALRLAVTVDDWIGDLHRRLRIAGAGGDNYTALAVWIGAPEEITVMEA